MKPVTEALAPALAARTAPVMAPLPMEFQGSSLSRMAIRAQSKVEYRPPQIAKFPKRGREGGREGRGGEGGEGGEGGGEGREEGRGGGRGGEGREGRGGGRGGEGRKVEGEVCTAGEHSQTYTAQCSMTMLHTQSNNMHTVHCTQNSQQVQPIGECVPNTF